MLRRSLRPLRAVARRQLSIAPPPVAAIPDNVWSLVEEYYQRSQTSISLQTLMKTGRGELLLEEEAPLVGDLGASQEEHTVLTQVANFIQHEMPIRLAHRIHDLDRVPLMRDMPSVQTVKSIYINSFLEILASPKVVSPQDEQDFAQTLQGLYHNHSNVLIQMAKGAYELRRDMRASSSKLEFERMSKCHSFLDRFYMSRIGIRVLAGQYLALRDSSGAPKGYVGMILSNTSPFEVVHKASKDATLMCVRKYGNAPSVNISGKLDLTFPYIPTHLHYIMLELLKNAMRATMDQHGSSREIPPVKVIIADAHDNEDIVIKVADEGGGIARSQLDKIWSYLYTTADPQIQEGFIGASTKDHSKDSPLAGLGYGLPISRSYARYFGGDLDIVSMEGFGTDAFCHLVRLGNSKEPLAV